MPASRWPGLGARGGIHGGSRPEQVSIRVSPEVGHVDYGLWPSFDDHGVRVDPVVMQGKAVARCS